MKKHFKIMILEERIVMDAAAIAVIYVNSHTNIQDALVKAASTPGADQIWIAQGTYTPSQIYSPNGVTGGASGLNDPHLATFNLPNNVSLYGDSQGQKNRYQKRIPLFIPLF